MPRNVRQTSKACLAGKAHFHATWMYSHIQQKWTKGHRACRQYKFQARKRLKVYISCEDTSSKIFTSKVGETQGFRRHPQPGSRISGNRRDLGAGLPKEKEPQNESLLGEDLLPQCDKSDITTAHHSRRSWKCDSLVQDVSDECEFTEMDLQLTQKKKKKASLLSDLTQEESALPKHLRRRTAETGS